MENRTPAPKKRSLYEILGVERDANPLDIGVAFKRRLAQLEAAPQQDENEINFVREAYRVLDSPKERAAYDASMVTREERAAAAAQETPDLVLEAEETPATKRPDKKMMGLILGGVVLALLIFLALRPKAPDIPPPPPVAAKPKPAEPPPPPKKVGAAEIAGLASRSVARILAYDMSGRTLTAGTGIVVASGALVTTCQGLPPNAQLVARIGKDDHPARLELNDEELNLCRLAAPEARSALVASSEELKVGDEVHAVAVHKDDQVTVVTTTVKGVRTRGERRDYELAAPVSPSASGGALFDGYGRFVGILTSREAGALAAGSIPRMRTRGGAVSK